MLPFQEPGTLPAIMLEGASAVSNKEYTDEGLIVWRTCTIGPGKLWETLNILQICMLLFWRLSCEEIAIITLTNIGTLSVQELFFQLIGWLGVDLGVSPVGMVYFMG